MLITLLYLSGALFVLAFCLTLCFNAQNVFIIPKATRDPLYACHIVSIAGLFLVAYTQLASNQVFTFSLGVVLGVVSLVLKCWKVKHLPTKTWQLTDRNQRLIENGRVLRFHIENDLQAFLPIIVFTLVAWHISG